MVLVALAGVGAGAINALVGSGTLITFPTLLLLGVPPLTANVSNNIGLVPGSLSGAYGYRRELGSNQSARCLAAYLYSAAGFGESTTDLAWDGHALIYENNELLAEAGIGDSLPDIPLTTPEGVSAVRTAIVPM